ncbi:MAG: glycine/betaine ABC transporter substrate-binding protein [Streptosporangiales bacterium]|nr:glycine/betaine ABC transporter substrate-binding protein [Streptosporangiales bacterium]
MTRIVALLAAVALAATGCIGTKVSEVTPPNAADCQLNLAINDWVGYYADAAVVSYIAEHELGCIVTQKNLKEEVAWQGFATGEVDAILENWGHDDLKQRYIKEQKVAVEAGWTGNIGQIGWYVPPWMVKKYPDILDYRNLNKYAKLFRTSESGQKGQLLDGDPAFVTNDAALVQNLELDYKVVYAGSEAALIQGFRQAERGKKPMLGYFYEPHWFFSDMKLAHVKLPPYETGCDADPQKVDCDYPELKLDKIVSAEFAEDDNAAYQLIKKFRWTNDDQNEVARSIAVDGLSNEEAAKKWVEAHPDAWRTWLPPRS